MPLIYATQPTFYYGKPCDLSKSFPVPEGELAALLSTGKFALVPAHEVHETAEAKPAAETRKANKPLKKSKP